VSVGEAWAGPDAFHLVAQAVLDGVLARLQPPPGRACVVPGAIAWDACDCDGMVAVSVTRTFLSSSFPAEAAAISTPCDAADLAADLQVQVLRCAPTPDEEGTPPGCEQLTAAALQVVTDAWQARLGAYCTLRDLRVAKRIEAFRVASQPVLGPEGGCCGSQLALTVATRGGCGCGP
jgi:hypothetical protein